MLVAISGSYGLLLMVRYIHLVGYWDIDKSMMNFAHYSIIDLILRTFRVSHFRTLINLVTLIIPYLLQIYHAARC